MKTSLLLLPLLFIIQSTFAQDSYEENDPFKIYKMESIYLQGNKYVKNGVPYPMGVFGSNLAKEMKISKHATAEWNSFVKFRNLSILTSLASVGLSFAALHADKATNRRNLVIGGLGLAVISIPLSAKAGNQLHRSVWTHNRDLFQ